LVDDIVDEPGKAGQKQEALKWWRCELNELYRGTPSHFVTQALLTSVDLFRLQKQDFIDIIKGMEKDSRGQVRLQNISELELYCDQVACAVGRLSVRVFGVPLELQLKLSFAQGQALQLTNILRDIKEDIILDRLYLPIDLLNSNSIHFNDIEEIIESPGLSSVCFYLAELAQSRYSEARALMSLCDQSIIRPARMMLEMYNLILCKLVDRRWKNLNCRVSLTKSEVLWTTMRYGVF